jgi:hypothetical protein
MRASIAVACLTTLFSVSAPCQWERAPDPTIPRKADGAPNLDAPTPRTADGKPNLAGIWLPDAVPLPEGFETVEGDAPFPRYMINVTVDLAPEAVELTPWATRRFDERRASQGRASPTANCRPIGVPFINSILWPYKIVQTPGLILVLYESDTVFRQIFLDGRSPVEGALPRYMGYSTGFWDGDELVVKTTGVSEGTWLDAMGHPHTESMVLIERFRRPSAGHLEIETTVDDPAAYVQPLTYTVSATAFPDDDLLEYFCSDNEKSIEHYQ